MKNKGTCELFESNKCLGCIGLEYDIDKLKFECDKYNEFNRKYENLKLEEV